MPILLLNIEDTQIFDEATVESNIITLIKGNKKQQFQVSLLKDDYMFSSSLSDYFIRNKFTYDATSQDEWIVSDESSLLLKKKIERGSKLLGELKVTINFGIKTGLNEAFIIDESIMNNLIDQDFKNSEIIKPILRGRDISKYNYFFNHQYLINSHNGLKESSMQIDRIDLKNKYPTLYNYLNKFNPKINKRSDQGDHWSNLRNCTYIYDFENPKIIWGEISDKPKFAYDDSGYYAEATTFLMTGENLKYLLAILNSKLSEWYFNQISTTTGMGTNRWKKYKIQQLPIKDISFPEQKPFIDLVDQILKLKKVNPEKDTGSLEKQIDQLVYQLYGLTEEEIKIVEGIAE